MKILICFILCISPFTWADNLLSNSGFDSIEPDSFPKGWDVFVMPMDGALGQLDSERHDGEFSAMLYNPEAYPKEPINNWSQIIYDDLAGQELWVSGTIRTEDATEAAIWVQCFKKNPIRVIASSSTSSEFPIYGTQGWTKVRTSIKIPQNTNFIVVRCILIGTGRAWYDTLLASTDKSEHVPLEEMTALEALEPDKKDEEFKVLPDENATLNDLLQLTLDMQSTILNMESTNDALVTRIEAMQRELALYRNELSENLNTLEFIEPNITEPRHPLVPYGYYSQEH